MQTLPPPLLQERRKVRKKTCKKNSSRQGTLLMGTKLNQIESHWIESKQNNLSIWVRTKPLELLLILLKQYDDFIHKCQSTFPKLNFFKIPLNYYFFHFFHFHNGQSLQKLSVTEKAWHSARDSGSWSWEDRLQDHLNSHCTVSRNLISLFTFFFFSNLIARDRMFKQVPNSFSSTHLLQASLFK